MKFWLRQKVTPTQRYGSAEALRELATAIEEHEERNSCAVEIETMELLIVAELSDNCVPLEVG